MSNKEPREALGARDGETLLDAAKRVVRERDEADGRYQSERCHRLSLQSEVEAVTQLFTQAERERDEARAEAERLQREHDEMGAELRDMSKKYDEVLEANVGLLDDAPWADVRRSYRRGAEAMREACAEACRPMLRSMASRSELAETIRALPIPEEP